VTDKVEGKGFGLNRWIVVLLLVVGIISRRQVCAHHPHIQLPGEPITMSCSRIPGLGPFYLTNTILATLLVDLVLFAMAFAVVRSMGDANTPSRGWANAFEAIHRRDCITWSSRLQANGRERFSLGLQLLSCSS
jgi:hypothetical protein